MDVLSTMNLPPLWICLTVVVLLLVFIYGWLPMSYWKRLQVPGPSSLPFIGNVHQFINPKTGVRANVLQWQKQYGSIVGIYYFRKPCLVVTDIDLLKEIFVKEYNVYHDRFFVADGHFFPEMFRKGVFFNMGADWKRIRRIMTGAFTSGKLKTLTSHINKSAKQLATNLAHQAQTVNRINAKDVFGAFSLDVIAGTAFSLDINSQIDKNSQFFQMVQALFKPNSGIKIATAIAGIFPFMGYLFNKVGISIFNPKSVRQISHLIEQLISERKNCIEGPKRRDAIQYLIDAEDDYTADDIQDKRLSKDEIISQGLTFLIAGYETTSSTLQFAAYLLARNQQAQNKLLDEIRDVIGDNDDITYEHCQTLTYTECVLNETMRLYPPVHLLKREANRATVLKDLPVPAKTGIFIPVYNIGRDPTLFEDPNTFNPDRYLSGKCSSNHISFLPFGFGPKQCIGMRLAMMELKIALVHVLRTVQFQNAFPETLEFDDFTGILLPRKPIILCLEPRKALSNGINLT